MNKRNPIIDILKLISIIMIIITHDPYFVENYTQPLCVFVLDMAVPIFIFISGYNYVKSVINHGFTKRELYRKSYILKRLFRFLSPYSLIFFSVMLLSIVFKGKEYTLYSVAIEYIKGGYGPGAYYTPIMIQFVLLSPIFYTILSAKKKKGLFIAFQANFLYEVILTYGHFPSFDYSRILFRYSFLIACGMYYAMCSGNTMLPNQTRNVALLASFVVGISYLTYTQYFHQAYIFKRWTTTSMIVAFYIIPFIHLFEKKYTKHAKNTNNKLIELISSATYHIYLSQMTYYYVGLCRFITISIPFRIIFNVVICILGGVVFYYFENKLKSLVTLLIARK